MTNPKKAIKRCKGQSASKARLGANDDVERAYRAGAEDERASIAISLFDKTGLYLNDINKHAPYKPST